MVRIRGKKSFEEVYGTSLEVNLQKAGMSNQNPAHKSTRKEVVHFGSPAFEGSHVARTGHQGSNGVKSHISPTDTNRRRTMKPSQDLKVPTSFISREEKIPMSVHEKQRRDISKLKTTRIEKDNNNMIYLNKVDNIERYNGNYTKECRNSSQLLQPSLSKPKNVINPHYDQPDAKQRDEDEDAEEFFEMIKQTVEGAVARTMSDLLGRNLVEVNAKLDCFAAELKSTQNKLAKVQSEINKQILHYGEESAKHFRYLCMKSEYDKMFYQHQAMVGSVQGNSRTCLNPNHMVPPSMVSLSMVPPNLTPQQMSSMPQMSIPTQSSAQIPQNIQMQMQQPPLVAQKANTSRKHLDLGAEGDVKLPCSCRNGPDNTSTQMGARNSASHTRSVANIASDAGLREVLGQIQRFCNQLQADDNEKNQNKKPRARFSFRPEGATIINKDVFALDEEDECASSSDNYSPMSMDQMNKYESKTIRATSRTAPNPGHN